MARGKLIGLLLASVFACAVAPGAANAGILYTNNYTDKQIAALSFGSDGLLTPIAGSPFVVDTFPQGIAITPDGRFAVAAFSFDDQVRAFALGADGSVSPTGTLLSAAVGPYAAVSPNGQYVYLPADTTGAFVFRIGSDGSLTQVGSTYGSVGASSATVTPDGRFVLLTSYTSNAIERLAVQPDGTLASLGTTTVGGAGGLLIRVTPDGKFAVLLTDPAGTGTVSVFAIGADGSLTPTGLPLATSGAIARFSALSPSGRFFYVPNSNEDSISIFSIDATGALTHVGVDVPSGLTSPREIAMSPDGRFLYVENETGATAMIQAFAVASDGSLTMIGSPVGTGGGTDGSTPFARPAQPPIAKFNLRAAAPKSMSTFDARGSTNPDGGAIATYAWDFGDGTTSSGGDATPSHAYEKAGVYTVTVVETDDEGCSVNFVFTGQSAYCNGGPSARATGTLDTPPLISGLRLLRKKFAVAAVAAKRIKRGTAFRYKLSETAKMKFTISRAVVGRKVGKTCKRRTNKNRRKPKCKRIVRLGSFYANARAGTNTTKFSGKLGRRKLGPGSYVAKLVATDSAGGKSVAKTIGFKIVKRR